MRTYRISVIQVVLPLALVFLISVITTKGGELGFVQIPVGTVDDELRAEVEALVTKLDSEYDLALGVTVLEGVTRKEALGHAAKVRSQEQFTDLSIRLVLSTAGPEHDGHLVRFNLPQPQDEKALTQPFFNAFGRCREERLDDRLRHLLAEIEDQVEVFVLQREHGKGKFGDIKKYEEVIPLEGGTTSEGSSRELWIVVVAVVGCLSIFFLGTRILIKALAPKPLRFDRVTISRRLQAPYTGGSPYYLNFKKKYRR